MSTFESIPAQVVQLQVLLGAALTRVRQLEQENAILPVAEQHRLGTHAGSRMSMLMTSNPTQCIVENESARRPESTARMAASVADLFGRLSSEVQP